MIAFYYIFFNNSDCCEYKLYSAERVGNQMNIIWKSDSCESQMTIYEQEMNKLVEKWNIK